MKRFAPWSLVVVVVVGAMLLAACGSGSSDDATVGSTTPTVSAVSATSSPATTQNAGQTVEIGGRKLYLDCRGTAAEGDPTIILVSGYHDSSDVWNQSDVLSLLNPAVGPPVQVALAASHRVCSYDRPGTLRYIEGVPLTDRSTPVAQPRTAAGRNSRPFRRYPPHHRHWKRPLHPVLAAGPRRRGN